MTQTLVTNYLLAGGVAILCGLDRTAAFQFMVSRPIVAGPLCGLVLGQPLLGLEAGALMELLWLGRLPMGAAIPPDDTQVTVGATFLAVTSLSLADISGFGAVLVATLVALPLGKAGQFFDRLARLRNNHLFHLAEQQVQKGAVDGVSAIHLRGMFHFGLASLATYSAIAAVGLVVVRTLGPFFIAPVEHSAHWIALAFPLVGTANILGTLHVSRALTLFGASFAMTLLLIWLL